MNLKIQCNMMALIIITQESNYGLINHRLSIDIIVCEIFNATSALVVKLAIHPPSKSRPGDSFGRFKSRNSA